MMHFMQCIQIFYCSSNEDIVFRILRYFLWFNETNHHQVGHGFDASMLRP